MSTHQPAREAASSAAQLRHQASVLLTQAVHSMKDAADLLDVAGNPTEAQWVRLMIGGPEAAVVVADTLLDRPAPPE